MSSNDLKQNIIVMYRNFVELREKLILLGELENKIGLLNDAFLWSMDNHPQLQSPDFSEFVKHLKDILHKQRVVSFSPS